jgi:hypothetical protein
LRGAARLSLRASRTAPFSAYLAAYTRVMALFAEKCATCWPKPHARRPAITRRMARRSRDACGGPRRPRLTLPIAIYI